MIPIFTKQSTYHPHIISKMLYIWSGRSEFSSSIITMSAKTGPRGEPMATPSVCTYVLNSKIKWTFLIDNIRISFISFFVIDVTISFFSYIIFKIISIVRFNWTFVNKDLTSNDTNLFCLDNFCCLNSPMNSLVFFTVFLDCHKGDNNLERYFAEFYVVVFRFETIGRIGSSLISPFTGSLCILVVK